MDSSNKTKKVIIGFGIRRLNIKKIEIEFDEEMILEKLHDVVEKAIGISCDLTIIDYDDKKHMTYYIILYQNQT